MHLFSKIFIERYHRPRWNILTPPTRQRFIQTVQHEERMTSTQIHPSVRVYSTWLNFSVFKATSHWLNLKKKTRQITRVIFKSPTPQRSSSSAAKRCRVGLFLCFLSVLLASAFSLLLLLGFMQYRCISGHENTSVITSTVLVHKLWNISGVSPLQI